MDDRLTALERAFQIAEFGSCNSVSEIKKQLTDEGYSLDQITGRSLSKQLRELLQPAKANPNT